MNAYKSNILWMSLILLTTYLDPLYSQINEGHLAQAQAKMVKVYGSGGFANLHSYQSGIFIDDAGTVLTVWSHVLDGKIVVVDNSGKRSIAEFAGMDPQTELAVLNTELVNNSFFDLNAIPEIFSGMSIFGISNLFGIAAQNEQQSLLSGVISGISSLDGASGRFDTPYRGEIILVDLIVNNPGAAGGAIIDYRGQLVGLIGKELKEKSTGLWLNFCLPLKVTRDSVKSIQEGASNNNSKKAKVRRPFRWQEIGVQWVPAVFKTTRPYVDRVADDSVGEKLGFQPDDLVVFINNQAIRTQADLNSAMQSIDRDEKFTVIVRRNNKLITINVSRVKS